MNRILKLSSVSLVIGLLIIISACGSDDDTASEKGKEEHVFRLANVMPETDPVGMGLNKFAEIVNEKSEGKIKIDVFHGGQLGSDLETYEAVANGNLDMASGSIANLDPITSAFDVFQLPFLFDSKEHAFNAINNEKVNVIVNDKLGENNLIWFGSLDSGGPRLIATKDKKIENMKDIKGLKLRASESQLEIASQQAMGAKGVTISWPETPQGLNQGMVDGTTVPMNAYYSSKLYEDGTIKNIAYIPFQWFFHSTVINQDKWEALPDDIKEIMTASFKEAEEWEVAYADENTSKAIKEMTDAGLEISILDEEAYEEIQNKTKDIVWEEYLNNSDEMQEKVDLINNQDLPTGELGNWGYKIE